MIRLLIFLTIVLSTYSAMHCLVHWGLRPLLPKSCRGRRAVRAFMALMVVSPVLVRLLERVDQEKIAQTLAWVAYPWMGLVFLCCCGYGALAAWNLSARFIHRLVPHAADLRLAGRIPATAVLLAAVAAGGYGRYEAQQLRVEQVRLESERLSPGTAPLRIAQISDLHLGLLLRQDSAEQVAATVASLQPDLLVATGDLVDARVNHLEELIAPFARLEPPLGKYAVIGNHEVYAGLPQAIDFLEQAGFTVLRDSAVSPAATLRIVGVDDPATAARPNELPLLHRRADGPFTLLLKHRPRVNPEALGHFDLQLSGHAHRGQIFPFSLVTGIEYPMQDGLYPLRGGGILYASRGTGTWGPPMRILSPPEITLIEIVPKGGEVVPLDFK